MSCCGGSGIGGARSRQYESGCNCGRGQSCGRFEPEAWSCKSTEQRETTLGRPTGGCGRPNCPKIVYPPPEAPEVEWEYTNYNRKNHNCAPASIESEYPQYRDDFVEEEFRPAQNYRWSESDDDFVAEKIPHDCDYCDRLEDNDYESYERVGGGCEDAWTSKETYLDYYDDEESVDRQDPNRTPIWTGCPRCSETRSPSEVDSDYRGPKRVHF